jgi:hypothetical protein
MQLARRRHFSAWLAVAAFTFFVLSDNPIVQASGLRVIPLFALFGVIYLAAAPSRLGKCFPFAVPMTVYASTATIASLHHGTHVPALFAALGIFCFCLAAAQPERSILELVRFLTGILIVTICLGIFALLVNGAFGIVWLRTASLEFAPFSFLYDNQPFKRPSGFMHEPGQLSFYICVCAACREMLRMPRSATIALLGLGLVTQSLAHLLFIGMFVIYLTLSHHGTRRRSHASIIVFVAVIGIFFAAGLLDWMIDRALGFTSNPENWGRFLSFNNCLNVLDSKLSNYLFGPSSELAARILGLEDQFSLELETVSIYGENPLSPLIFGGLLSSWPYYAFILFGLWCIIARRRYGWLMFGVALLTLQRPYTLEFPYSLIIGVLLATWRLSVGRSPRMRTQSREPRPSGIGAVRSTASTARI